MKVLHVNCNYIYTRLHQLLVRNLTKAGIDNQVYSPVVSKANGVIDTGANEIVSACFNKYDRYFFDYKQFKIFKDICAKVQVKEYDLIHAYTLFTDGNIAAKLSRKYGIPYVVAIRDSDVNAFFKKAVYLRKRGVQILEGASAVFFLSESYKNTVFEKYIPSSKRKSIEEKCHIIPNGIDSFWLDHLYLQKNFADTEARLKENKLNAIYVGAVSRRKNVKVTLQALDILRRKGWDIHFTVIGGNEDAEQMQAVLQDKHTEYLGKKPKEEIISYLRKSDVFIMPSITETFGLTYAEAMSQGLPVIYSSGQGFDGQFKEGEVGYHVHCHSAEEVAEKVALIAQNYTVISRNCMNLVGRFNWGDIASEYCGIYQVITRRRVGK